MKDLYKLVCAATLLIAMQACSEVLDTEPSLSMTPETVLHTKSGIKGLRTNLYARVHTYTLSTHYMLVPEALADQLTVQGNINRLKAAVTYGVRQGGSGVGTWDFSYETINLANILIHKIPKDILEQHLRKQYRGEAFWWRAFAYFNLVRAYAYEPGMSPNRGPGAGWTLGVPIRTKPVLKAERATYHPRKPVKEVYDLIISDLKKSINLLDNGNDSNKRYYVTEAAAHALLARVQLYARNYKAANKQAELALQTTSAHLVPPEGVDTMFDETAGLNPGAIFVGVIDPATESVGFQSAISTYTSEVWMAGIPTQDVMDLYSMNDARLAWFGRCFDETAGAVPPQGCVATHPAFPNAMQEGLELQKWNAEAGNYADDIPYLRVAEMLFIQAEARLKGGFGNPLAPLNKMRNARGLSDYTGNNIMQAILNGRRREFIGEGMRFWDLKRLGMDIPKVPSQIRFNSDLTDMQYSNYRIIDKIPIDEIRLSEQNAPEDSVLVQNPGY